MKTYYKLMIPTIIHLYLWVQVIIFVDSQAQVGIHASKIQRQIHMIAVMIIKN